MTFDDVEQAITAMLDANPPDNDMVSGCWEFSKWYHLRIRRYHKLLDSLDALRTRVRATLADERREAGIRAVRP